MTTISELERRINRLESKIVTLEQINSQLAEANANISSVNQSITDINTEMDNIKRKLAILIMQIDPVIAGTTRTLHGACDEEISTTSSSYDDTIKKSGRIIRTAYYYFTKLYVQAELKIVGGSRAYVGLYINGSKVAEGSTTSASYTTVKFNWDWAGLSNDTWYDIEYKIKATGGGTAYNRGLELIIHKPGITS